MNSDVLFYRKDRISLRITTATYQTQSVVLLCLPDHFQQLFSKDSPGIPSDCKIPLFRIDCLIIIVGSYGMIPMPTCWVSSGSWVPEDYFKLLQTSKSLQNTREMSNWKMMKFNQNITICVKSKMAFSTLLLAWKFIFFGARGLNVILICISIN